MLDEQFDTVYPTSVDPEGDTRTVRIRGTALGRLTPGGWFEAAQAPVQVDVRVVRRDGQWRIARLPGGRARADVGLPRQLPHRQDLVRRSRAPGRRAGPALPAGHPARAQAARAMELLLAGPSTALQGAASSMLPPGAQLRSNVATSPEGALIVDLTQVGELDETGRRLLAAQVVLSLAEVSVGAGPAARRRRAAARRPPRPDPRRRGVAGRRAGAGADVPALVVYGGRVHQLDGAQPTPRCPGRSATASWRVQSAASSPDGRRIAVVAADGRAAAGC